MTAHKVRIGEDTKAALQLVQKNSAYSVDELLRMWIQHLLQVGAVDKETHKQIAKVWHHPTLRYAQREAIPQDRLMLPLPESLQELQQTLELLSDRIAELSSETLAGSELLLEMEQPV